MSDPETGTGAFVNAVDGSNKLVDLIRAVDKLIFTSSLEKRAAAQELTDRRKAELGPWHDFLYDKTQNMYFTPTLSASKFNKYLRTCKGAFRPTGECMATGAWTHFLHGLGITPEHGVVQKRPFQGSSNTEICLEVDGEVIGHVVNLLELSEPWDSYGTRSRQKRACNGLYETTIGDIKYTHDAESDITSLTFRHVNVGSKTHHFFNLENQDIDTVLTRYDLALDSKLGVSDTSLTWPPPSTVHISERLNRLLDNRDAVQHQSIPRDQRPLFVTESWHKGAERIRHRAVGGKEHAHMFFSDASKKFKPGTDVHRMLELWILKPYECAYMDWERSVSEPVEVGQSIRDTLQSYGNEPLASWKHDMYLYREALCNLLTKGAEDRFDMRGLGKVHILTVDSATKLWRERALRMEGTLSP